jgi:hypothetical protein
MEQKPLQERICALLIEGPTTPMVLARTLKDSEGGVLTALFHLQGSGLITFVAGTWRLNDGRAACEQLLSTRSRIPMNSA